METLIIRFGRCEIFAAVFGNQRIDVCCFGDMDDGVITGIQGVILTNRDLAVNGLIRQIVRRHIEHGNGIIAGFSENVLQIAAGIRCSGCLVRRLRQRFRLRRVADKERDVLCALAAGCARVCAGYSCGERSLIANLHGCRRSCRMNHRIAAFVVTETRRCRKNRDFGRIVARRILAVEHLKRDAHQTNSIAVMELNVIPTCF